VEKHAAKAAETCDHDGSSTQELPMADKYFPAIFETGDIARAREIILTSEGPGADTETRWALETPYSLELISNSFPVSPGMLVLDYGCGIGRMAKAMIEQFGCNVIGVDISHTMRAMAADYVRSDRFIAVSPQQLDILTQAGLKTNAAISIWVLQHCLAPQDDIARIRASLNPGGDFFVMNMPKRAIPIMNTENMVNNGFRWEHDNIDVAHLLAESFAVKSQGEPDRARIPNVADAGAFYVHLQKADASLA
jgi:SAM-dependent methyltransferase